MTLWIISNIAGSLLGAATSKWFYKKFESIANWASNRYGIDILDKEQIKWKTKYPNVAKKIEELETRIKELENDGLDKK